LALGWFLCRQCHLKSFFNPHYLVHFIIAGVSILHLAALHQYGYNNPLGINLVGWVAFAILFLFFIFYAPNVLGHPNNYIPANPMSTLAHIVP
jgi:ubiquinol-cytochrome c reductase cytochrome b subunit